MAVPRPGIAAPPSRRWPDAPVALFGMVLGLGGLANCWRTAARLWGWSALPGEALALVAATVWGALLALYLGKWIWLPRAALAELRHPIGSSFVALAPIATAIASIAVAPYVPDTARTLMIAGVAGQTVAAIHAIAGILTGERDREATTPALYVPVVGGFLVSAIASAAFGFPEWGALFFGATKLVEALEDALPARVLVLDLKNVIYVDSTGAEALENLLQTCRRQGVRLVVSGLMAQPLDIARRTGLLERLQAQSDQDLQPDVASAIDTAVAGLAPVDAPATAQGDAEPGPART